jgi:K+-sensing histidine kinase KdpD
MGWMKTRSARAGRGVTGDVRRELLESMATPVGSACALVLPMFLAPLRGLVGRTPLLAIVAVLVAVVAVVGGRWPGVTASGVGALSADAFLTAHRGAIHPEHLQFWWTAVLLVLVALSTAAIGRR